MFREFVESCFATLRQLDANAAKSKFGLIWAAFASKKIVLKQGVVQLSWRDLSAQLAMIYNDWFGLQFTTDAFYNAYDYKKPMGESEEYDEVLLMIHQHPECNGIFIVHNSTMMSSVATCVAFSQTDIVTGEQQYFKQAYENGRPTSEPERITPEEHDRLCYSAR